MAPYEALYGRKCKSPIYWDREGSEFIEGPDIVQMTVDKVNIIKSKLKAVQDRQKSYVDQHCNTLTRKSPRNSRALVSRTYNIHMNLNTDP